jgi:hypothetical protein
MHNFSLEDSKKGGIARGKTLMYFPMSRANLAYLFGVSVNTLSYWIKIKRLNPYSIEDIRDKLLHPELLYHSNPPPLLSRYKQEILNPPISPTK